ncbi:hypothetical protein R6Q57_021336 [Mikania cordata]
MEVDNGGSPMSEVVRVPKNYVLEDDDKKHAKENQRKQAEQLCDGPIIAFTVLHNMYCNHGFIYVTSQGTLKICQLPSLLSYDNYWPVQKIPLKATPHQVTYFPEKNLYPLIVSVPVSKPINQVLSSLVDQESGHQIEHDNPNLDGTYTVEEFEVRILEPESSSGSWQTKGTIHMQTSENALTVRVVTLSNTTTRENETLLAIGTAYVQGEDVAARGRVLLFSVESSTENSQAKVTEVYSKEMKGAISALASIKGYLLVASGPKVILHKWTGSELNGVAFFDAPPLYVVSLNIVKNFILIGDIHKSIYFLSWKENGSQLTLLAKDFGNLDCFATEFLIDGTTLSLLVSDAQKNVQILCYAPKASESWKGQKLLSRAEFHVGAHVTKFLRLPMFSASTDPPGSDKTKRFALMFATLDGSIGCIAPLDELTFRRLQSLQKKLVDAVPHVAGLNPRSFRQFHSNGKAHRPGPDSLVDCELLCHYDMLPFEHQHEIANQIGTTRSQIISNLNDLALGTYDLAMDVARANNAAARSLLGSKAKTNFPAIYSTLSSHDHTIHDHTKPWQTASGMSNTVELKRGEDELMPLLVDCRRASLIRHGR